MPSNQAFELEKIDNLRQKGLRPIVVCCIVNGNKLLMVYHQEYDLWFLPQGGINNKELFNQALQRETIEELGQSFFNNCQKNYQFIGTDRILFPRYAQDTRELITDNNQQVEMLGKKYFFYLIKANNQEINIKETEFNDFQWVNYNQGINLTKTIYQKGKKRITLKVLNILKEKKYIN